MASLIYGENRSFRCIVERAEKYAPTEWPILLLGETGVGKELFAQHLHRHSKRAAGPFVPVNCGAIPAGLFESELFGHERGAFSGAVQPSRGLFRMAHRGTLFLDEIGELEPIVQAKLLRALDSGEVRAIGSQKIERQDVRIIAATNVDLDSAVAQGYFRSDLLERLSVLRLSIPPLQDRSEDIPLIARAMAAAMGFSIDESVFTILGSFNWPGNVRQLRNVLVRAWAQSGGTRVRLEVVREILADEERRMKVSSQPSEAHVQGSLADIEKQAIVERLKKYRGNRKRAAEDLGIAKSTLHEKLRRWKQESPEDVGWPVARLDASHASVQ